MKLVAFKTAPTKEEDILDNANSKGMVLINYGVR